MAAIATPSSQERFILHRQLSLNIAFVTERNYHFQQHQNQLTPNSLHPIFTFIMPVLLNFLQLMYQAKNYSPFDTHPFTMWIGLGCTLAYCLILGVETTYVNPVYEGVLHRCRILFSSLSLASLASVIFPHFLQPLLYCLCALLSLRELLNMAVETLRKWIQNRVLPRLCARWLTSNSFRDQANILPV